MPQKPTKKAAPLAAVKQLTIRPVVQSPAPAPLFANHVQVTAIGVGTQEPQNVTLNFYAATMPLATDPPPDCVDAPLVARIVVPVPIWLELVQKAGKTQPSQLIRPKGQKG